MELWNWLAVPSKMLPTASGNKLPAIKAGNESGVTFLPSHSFPALVVQGTNDARRKQGGCPINSTEARIREAKDPAPHAGSLTGAARLHERREGRRVFGLFGQGNQEAEEVSDSQDVHAAKSAAEFNLTFEPQEGVEYGWVVKHAREQYEEAKKVFELLDAKATAIITYLSSGAGLLTIGSIIAIATAKVSEVVVWCAVPAMICSCVALVFALRARRPLPVFPPAGAPKAVAFANHYKSAENAEAAFLSHWYLLTVLLRPIIGIKSWNVANATRLVVATAGLLILPLFAALLAPAPKPEEQKPLPVIVSYSTAPPLPSSQSKPASSD